MREARSLGFEIAFTRKNHRKPRASSGALVSFRVATATLSIKSDLKADRFSALTAGEELNRKDLKKEGQAEIGM